MLYTEEFTLCAVGVLDLLSGELVPLEGLVGLEPVAVIVHKFTGKPAVRAVLKALTPLLAAGTVFYFLYLLSFGREGGDVIQDLAAAFGVRVPFLDDKVFLVYFLLRVLSHCSRDEEKGCGRQYE